ncbi:unnamed protein product [Effrenium voratum]|nr:unnamed protein product [Effrenium voratum]
MMNYSSQMDVVPILALCRSKKSLEVLVERPPFTPCFQASFTKADWLQLCWYDSASDAPHTVHFDLEVLAMIQLGLRDRRLLRCHEPTPVPGTSASFTTTFA